ncbi:MULTISPECIES: hypothetical protein [Bacillus]|uniref:hypothetical protein n=1 Tax=Bacillus TaxID=1386 RepID=UPI000BB8CF18|nr:MULTISPECIES: hypothetical protein [Bacillus]
MIKKIIISSIALIMFLQIGLITNYANAKNSLSNSEVEALNLHSNLPSSSLELNPKEEKVITFTEYYMPNKSGELELVTDPNMIRSLEIHSTSEFTPMNSLDPGPGAVRVNGYLIGASGTNFAQQEKGIFDSIKNIAMYVVVSGVKTFVTTAGNVILDLAGIISTDVNTKSSVTSTISYSLTYPGKEGQIYNSNKTWTSKYDARSRYTWKHYYGIWQDRNGQARQYVYDYTTRNGHSPVKREYSPNYSNNTYIANEAYRRWTYNLPKGAENWATK